MTKKDVLWTISLMILVALLAVLTLIVVNGGSNSVLISSNRDVLERYRKLDSVYQTIMKDYYEEVDPDVLLTGAMTGMLEALEDPYTFYYSTEQKTVREERDDGIYHGIGIVVIRQGEGSIFVNTVYEASPAWNAGIHVNDQIIAVNGEPVSAATNEEYLDAVERMRGEDGSELTLTIVRTREDGTEEQMNLTLIHGNVKVPNVAWTHLEDGIGYIAISQFAGDVCTLFQQAVEEMKDSKAIVLDLRGNPGGNLNDVLEIADILLPKALILSVEPRSSERTNYCSDEEWWDIPLAVLVNQGSASASEVLSAAIRDNGRGILIGKRTYGKGIVQTVLTFTDGEGGMQYTSARYYTPANICIHENGLEPDIEVEDPNAFDRFSPDPEADGQLKAAVEYLTRNLQ